MPGGVSDADFTIGGRDFVIQSYADGLDRCVTGFHRESPPLLFDVDLPLALLDLLVLGSEGSGGDGYVDLDRGLSLGLDFIYHTICRRICQGKPSEDIIEWFSIANKLYLRKAFTWI